jgi:catechol 2,3-dioxygenase-like lactoylglutathione lyase family enzyme
MSTSKQYPRLTPELYCTDIKLSLEFYVKTLGFNIEYDRPEDAFAFLNYQGAEIMLEQFDNPNGQKWLPAPLERPFGRGINFQIETDEVDALYARVKMSNAQIISELHDKWYRATDVYVGNRQFVATDPDGYMLRFYQDLGSRESIPE